MRKNCYWVSFIVFVFFSVNLFAQSSGKITGRVIDKDTGEELPYANVFIEGTTQGTATDLEGNYVILNVRPGVYEVSASVVGYQKVSVTDVRVNVDFTTRLDFQLSMGSIDLPTIVVQGERNPLIRQDLTNPTVAITAETISELPVDQISDIIKLQAGVVTSDDGSLHVRGGRSNEIAYSLNGVSLNDPYGNQRSIGIATNAVQEVSVSTGTFSAQYGGALSGVVNYVTKEGGDKYSLSLRGYSGDYVTSRTDLFPQLDKIDPLNRGRVEGTIGGPLPFFKNARFYISSVYENFKGHLYGRRLYNPTDSYLSLDNFRTGDPRRGTSTSPYFFNPYDTSSTGLPSGNGEWVAMNWSNSWNMQGNISFRLSPLFKVKYEALYDQSEWQNYSNNYKYNPDGIGTNYSTGLVQSADITHTVGDKLFYTLKFSYGINESKYYLFENPLDQGYLPALYRRSIGNTFFYAGGTDNYRQERKTTTTGIKGDLVTQMFGNHEIKLGFEARLHKLTFEGYNVEIGKLNPNGTFGNLINDDLLYDSNLVVLRRIPTSPSLYTNFEKTPMQISAYIQDKIEFHQSFILNAGVRYEYFDPAAEYNPNISQNLSDSLFGFISAYNLASEKKHSVSPRISVSYPITDKGIIRLSYGHFYQIGSLSSLYNNHQYYVDNVGSTPTFGNPNVEPQRSVQYEIGLQQLLTDDLKFDLTAFYKNVNNYIYTQTVYTERGRQYNILTNLAYANSRGVTFSIIKRRSPGSFFQASLDYTFSVSEGNRTEPSDELFFSEQSGKQTETYLVALGFDRTHVINGTVGLSDPNNWTAGVIFNLQTGTPYTPSFPSRLVPIRFEQNSANQSIQWNVDLKLEKFFTLGPLQYSIFLQVDNLFDIENELAVYASSGRALSNVEETLDAVQFNDERRRIERGDPGLFGMEQIDNYYSWRPERVNRPREVRLGFSLLFN